MQIAKGSLVQRAFSSLYRALLKKINWGNWGIRAGALALAFFLWFYAVTEHLYEKEVFVRLQVEPPPALRAQSREIIVANLLPEYVRVSVSGLGRDLLQLDGDDFILRLQAEGAAGSARSYRLTPAMVENRTTDLEIGIETIVEPREIQVTLDWRDVREVPIRPLVELEIAEAHVQVGEIGLEPRTVRISGPSRQIDQVAHVETDSLILRGVRENVDHQLLLHSPLGMPANLDPRYVRVQANVQILAEHPFARIPVKVRHAGGRKIGVEPPTVQVKVRGGFDIIAHLDAEKDLELFVDYRDFVGENLVILSESSSLFEVVEIIPPQVALVER